MVCRVSQVRGLLIFVQIIHQVPVPSGSEICECAPFHRSAEAPSERPLSRDMNRELRKKFVNPVPDAEMAHHSKAPSNVAYAIASRPFSEVREEVKHSDVIKIIIFILY